MIIPLCAAAGGKVLRINWISLAPNGDISVGLSDRAFIARDFDAKQFVCSAFNRIREAYLVPDDPRAARPSSNPI